MSGATTAATAHTLLTINGREPDQDEKTCPTCKGRGGVNDWRPIPMKHETPYRAAQNFYRKCPTCGGSGKAT